MKIIFDLLFAVFNLFAEPMAVFVLSVFVLLFYFIGRKKNFFKGRKVITVVAAIYLVLIIAFANGFIGRLFCKYLQQEYAKPEIIRNENAAIVVLGGGITHFNGHETLHSFSYSRVLATAELYYKMKKSGINPKIITSGLGRGNSVSEAKLYAKELNNIGIPSEDITIEDRSLNTFQNAEYSAAILRDKGIRSAYIVTSGFHIKRSLAMFSFFGISSMAYPSDYVNTYITFLPNSYNCAIGSLTLHEILGIARFYIYNAFGINKKVK